MATISQKKTDYAKRLLSLLSDHNKVLLIGADNVGSKHLQDIRKELRGRATILMGKNTLIRRCLREPETLNIPDFEVKKNPAWDLLLPKIRQNVGFVFCEGDLLDVKNDIAANLVGAAAKAGAIAPCDVFVPKGPTGMDPTQTSFFQALSIATMIQRGQIEIKQDVHLVQEGEKVGASEATLLQKLGIRPFKYGLKVLQVFEDGELYSASVLDVTEADITAAFTDGVRSVAGVSLTLNYPSIAMVPHAIADGFKKLMAVSVVTDYTFKESEAIKAFFENPEAFAVAAPAGDDAGDDQKDAEPESSSDDDVDAGGLFGDDEDY